MRDHAMDFYADLFGVEQCSIEGRAELLEGLPQLSPEEKAALDLELTLEELTGAVNQMASGRAPGVDGLSGEFLKHFWGIISRADLHGVFIRVLQNRIPPGVLSEGGAFPAAKKRRLGPTKELEAFSPFDCGL
ncbi:hypothetical protein NHX12_009354 [Muraenolepis orangiensis]|uniref:Uncharacterized protein n=1 Tax=Muraenolepis orangiensis TaxID=630683 RepID=A0A9Q0DLB8_9TELE|nr:hypothetical protein NHX12_009354 [Muraenolepis orangiensis]